MMLPEVTLRGTAITGRTGIVKTTTLPEIRPGEIDSRQRTRQRSGRRPQRLECALKARKMKEKLWKKRKKQRTAQSYG